MTIGRRGEVLGDAVHRPPRLAGPLAKMGDAVHRPTKAGRAVGKDAPVCDFALVEETFVRRMS